MKLQLRPGEFIPLQALTLSIAKLEELDYSCLRPVWTMTTGRSGTQWLTRLLNHLEGIRAHHEPCPPLFNEARLLRDGNLDGMTELGWVRLLRACRTQLTSNAMGRDMRYVETTPLLTPLAPYLARAFPGSRFIHLVRDPRGFAASAASRGWGQRPHVQEHWFPSAPPEVDRLTPKEPLVARNLWLWNDVHRQALENEEELDVYRIRAEDMWTDHAAVAGLLRWLGAPDELIDRFGGLIAGMQSSPVNVGNGRGWKRRWDKALLELCGETASRFGYFD